MDNKNKNRAELPDDERLNMAPLPKAFTVQKIIEIAIGLIAVVLGILYLKTDLIPLGVLLPLYSVFFAAIPILRASDAKKTGGGFIAYLPAMCWGLLAVCVIGVTIAYFII